MLIDEFEEDFRISLNPFGVQDPVKTLEKFCCNCWFLFLGKSEFDARASAMEGLNKFIFIVAGEDESTIGVEGFDVGSEEELNIVSSVVGFIYNYNLMRTCL